VRIRTQVDGSALYVSANGKGWGQEEIPSGVARFIGGLSISVPRSSSAYKPNVDGVKLRSALSELEPSGHLTEGAPTTIGGQSLIPLTGDIPASAGAGKGKLTVYVSRSDHPLPAYARSSFSLKGQRSTAEVALSGWGEHVSARPPVDPIAIGALPAVVAAAGGIALTHYATFTGPHGDAPPTARPWTGPQCKPIRLEVERDVPHAIYPQVVRVVDEARADGIDITVETPDGKWDPASLYYRDGQSPKTAALVKLYASDRTPPKLSTGGREHIGFNFTTKLSTDRKHEQFRFVEGLLWLKTVGADPMIQRRSIRQLIALTQGIGATNLSGSAIAQKSVTDHFTLPDIAAMLQMSGCVKRASIKSLTEPGKVTAPSTNSAGQPLKFR
jgi:hypothetical protein